MTTELYIHSASKISNGSAWNQEEMIFRGENADPADFLPALYRHLQITYPKWYKMDRLSQLGILATELLLPKVDRESLKGYETATVIAEKHASLDTDIRFAAQLQDIPSPAVFVYTLPNIVIGEITIRNGFKGEQACFLMEKPDLDFLQQYVRTIFAAGNTNACIMGWLDIFGGQYEAVLFLVRNFAKPDNPATILNTNNLYQYLYHEQGAVN